MAKTKNDPTRYTKREVAAPDQRTRCIPTPENIDRNSAFFTAPLKGGVYLDLRDIDKDRKR